MISIKQIKMISIKQINKKDIDLCYELDSKTISLWSKEQWGNEFEKDGTKIIGLLIKNLVIGICVFQVVLDEAQINYFVVNKKFRKKGFGSYLMSYLICLLYTSPSPRDRTRSRMPSSA